MCLLQQCLSIFRQLPKCRGSKWKHPSNNHSSKTGEYDSIPQCGLTTMGLRRWDSPGFTTMKKSQTPGRSSNRLCIVEPRSCQKFRATPQSWTTFQKELDAGYPGSNKDSLWIFYIQRPMWLWIQESIDCGLWSWAQCAYTCTHDVYGLTSLCVWYVHLHVHKQCSGKVCTLRIDVQLESSNHAKQQHCFTASAESSNWWRNDQWTFRQVCSKPSPRQLRYANICFCSF